MAKSLLFRCSKEVGLPCKRQLVEALVPVRIAAAPAVKFSDRLTRPSASVPVPHEAGSIEVELVGGIKLRVITTRIAKLAKRQRPKKSAAAKPTLN